MYTRRTKDVWRLFWKGYYVDTFDDYEEAIRCKAEYELAFGGAVEIKKGWEVI